MSIRVFLADDHAVFRESLRAYLNAQTDMTIIGDAGDGPATLQEATRLLPEVLVIDITMPGLDGIEVVRRLKAKKLPIRVVILSMHATAEHLFQALEVGALGYVLKGSSVAQLITAIRAASRGAKYLDSHMPEPVMNLYRQMVSTKMPPPLSRLTPREREVMHLVMQGKSSAEISKLLSLSISSVDTYRSRLMEKLGVGNIVELVKFAIQHRIIPD